MKNSILGSILFAAVAMFCAPVYAAEEAVVHDPVTAGNPVGQFTGKYWVDTSGSSKEAYLFGIESAITVEYFVNSKMTAKAAKAGKKPAYMLSPFEKGWMEAFRNTTRKEMIDEINKWYAEHPQNLDRPVMDVIWYELIEPRLKAENK